MLRASRGLVRRLHRPGNAERPVTVPRNVVFPGKYGSLMKRPAQIFVVGCVAVVGLFALMSHAAAPADETSVSDSKTPMCECGRHEAASRTGPEKGCGECAGGKCAGGCQGGRCHGRAEVSEVAVEEHAVGQRRGRGPGAGRGPGRGRHGGRGPDADFQRDRDVFHYLLEHHTQIRRTVRQLDNGVETLTESDDPEVTKAIQEHVHAMYRRVKGNRPIRRRDPLFNAIFNHASKVKMQVEETEKGVRVVETSDDPFVVRLIQAHAEVVSAFVKSGHAEAMKNHPVPAAR